MDSLICGVIPLGPPTFLFLAGSPGLLAVASSLVPPARWNGSHRPSPIQTFNHP
jgi:hypothetical protein